MQKVFAFGARLFRTGLVRRWSYGVFVCGVTWTLLVLQPLLTGGNFSVRAANQLGGAALAGEEKTRSPLGQYLAGRFARYLGDQGSAARFYKEALANDPRNSILRARTYRLLAAAGHIKEAVAIAKTIHVSNEDDGLAMTVVALSYVQKEHFADALDKLNRVPPVGLGKLVRPTLEAWVSAGMNDLPNATAALSKLSSSEPFAAYGQYHRALIEDLLDVSQVGVTYRELIDNEATRSLRAIEAYASFLRRSGREKESIELFDRYLPLTSSNILVQHARFLAQQDKPDRFIKSASEGIAEALYGAARALVKNKETELGKIYCQLAVYLRPGFDIAYMLIGEIAESEQQWPEAIRNYQLVAKDSPLGWNSRLRIARNLDRLDRFNEAVEMLSVMAEEEPRKLEALILLGDLYRTNERWFPAVREYDRAAGRLQQVSQRDWRLFYSLGIALERTKQWDKAEANFLKALKLEPEQPLVLNYLGYSWVEQGKNLFRARKMIEKAVELRPRDGYIVDSLGWVLYRLGDYVGAVKNLERAVLLRPNDPVINAHLGDAYWRVQRFREARFQWKRALTFEVDPIETRKIEDKLREGL